MPHSGPEQGDFFESAAVALHWVGPDGRILRANQADLDLLGYRDDEYVGRHVADFHIDRDIADDMLRKLAAGETVRHCEASLRCKDGSIRHVMIDANGLWEDAGFVHSCCFTRDITEQKRAERALRFLADASKVLVELLDDENALRNVARLATPAFADWCVVDIVEGEVSLHRLAVAHQDLEKARRAEERAREYPDYPCLPELAAEVARGGVSQIRRIDEATIEACISVEPHRAALRELGLNATLAAPIKLRGKVLGVITFMTEAPGRRFDDSDRTIAEDLAQRSAIALDNARLYREVREADLHKNEFLAMLAHELRNPLAPVGNAVQILRGQNNSSQEMRWAGDVIERQLLQMTRLVDDLLDISRISRGKFELRKEWIHLDTVVHNAVEACRLFIEKCGHELTVALPSDSIRLEADAARLTQVILNLLNNAAKYTEPGGHIWLSAVREGLQIVIRVKDTGIGIPPEKLGNIFDMFMQADRSLERAQGGLGIGLALVRRLVEMHGGTVEPRSAGLHKGSEFIVRLPIAAGDSRTVRRGPAPGSKPQPVVGQKRILVVDDNRDAADSLARLLRMARHEVHTAYDGLEALEKSQALQPRVIILDIGLPKMNGYDVARQLRQAPGGSDLTLIALTGWGQDEDRRQATKAGFDHHMTKPIEFELLKQVLGNDG